MKKPISVRTKGDETLKIPRDIPLAAHVYQALLEGIQQGRFLQGDRIREDEVASWLKVSRTPVREALHKLQARGLLTFAPGRGVVVTMLSREQVTQLYGLRELLEGGAARLAAENATQFELDLLWCLIHSYEEAGDDNMERTKTNVRLHQAIYVAAHNEYLLSSLSDLQDSFALIEACTEPVRSENSAVEHTAIVKAVEARAADKAEAAARKHVREACRARLSVLA